LVVSGVSGIGDPTTSLPQVGGRFGPFAHAGERFAQFRAPSRATARRLVAMRQILLAALLLLGLSVPGANAQTGTNQADLDGIKQAALDYAESWYEGKPERMERALHPDLAKRIVRTDPASGRSRLEHMGAFQLYMGVRAGYGTKTPADKQLKDVRVLDVFGNAATVRLEMSGWIDYLHIAKFNGRWVIVNVLWEMKP
jgi:hypothetical protein